jgi:hypothetical protein
MTYGTGGHGWVGNVHVAPLQVGNMTPVRFVGVATMTQAVNETGNACGTPAPGSSGSVKMDGIFGFGLPGKGTNYFCAPKPGGYSNFWTPEQLSAGISSQDQCGGQQFTAPWQSLLGGQVEVKNMAWGLYWTGEMGTGSLYSGQAAYNMFEHYADLETTVWLEMTAREYGNYGLDFFQFSIDMPGAETVTVPFTSTPGLTNFDTGTYNIHFPKQIIGAAQNYFAATKDVDATATVKISAKTPAGAKVVPLTFELNRTQTEIAMENQDIGEDDDGCLGFTIMLWYEAVLVDIGGNKIGLAKRAVPLIG